MSRSILVREHHRHHALCLTRVGGIVRGFVKIAFREIIDLKEAKPLADRKRVEVALAVRIVAGLKSFGVMPAMAASTFVLKASSRAAIPAESKTCPRALFAGCLRYRSFNSAMCRAYALCPLVIDVSC